MKKEEKMLKEIENAAKKFLEISKGKRIKVLSHYDCDGITSAAIITRTLQRLDKKFSLSFIKQLDKEVVMNLPKNEIIIFTDLGTSGLKYFKEIENIVFVLDHHEITDPVPSNVYLINPHLYNADNISSAGISYLFSKSLNQDNKDLSKIAVIGMVGDLHDQNINKMYKDILKDANTAIRKGILLYPATRPINKVLEFNSSIFIKGVTGNPKGVFSLLKEAGIEKKAGKWKSLIELDDKEMSQLITSILLRRSNQKNDDIIGNIYMIKFFNKFEDAREISARINACSRLGNSEIALGLCLENKFAKKESEKIHVKYRRHLINGLDYVNNMKEKIEGNNFTIINAKDNIKDTIIGTITSILSRSSEYDEGTILIAMAYNGDKIKVSARISGRKGRNLKELIESVMTSIGGEYGGHHFAAGCLINKEDEDKFIDLMKKRLEIEIVKV